MSIQTKKMGIHKATINPQVIALGLDINYTRDNWYDDYSETEIVIIQVTGYDSDNISLGKQVYLGEYDLKSYLVMTTGTIIGTNERIIQVEMLNTKDHTPIKKFWYITLETYKSVTL